MKAINQIRKPKIMAPMRGLRLSSKLDDNAVAIVPAPRVGSSFVC
jgi:hypothetical protein